jgi:hypothetical protein
MEDRRSENNVKNRFFSLLKKNKDFIIKSVATDPKFQGMDEEKLMAEF